MTTKNKAAQVAGTGTASNDAIKRNPIIELFIQGYKGKNQSIELLARASEMLPQEVANCINDDPWPLPTAMMLCSPPLYCPFALGVYDGICVCEPCSHWISIGNADTPGACALMSEESSHVPE